MIQFTNVIKRYASGQEALSNISFDIAKGDMAFLTGHSGAGKSTLLKLIACIERPTSGQVVVNGRNLAHIKRAQVPALRRQIGMIFQDHKLIAERTVFDNVALPLIIAGLHNPAEMARRVRAALDKVGLLGKEKQFPVTLSSGEQQRVGIARAVVNKPAVLLADEPTGNLDPDLAAEVMGLFEQFNQVGVTVLIVSHNLGLISRFGRRILNLEKGCLLSSTEEAPPCA